MDARRDGIFSARIHSGKLPVDGLRTVTATGLRGEPTTGLRTVTVTGLRGETVDGQKSETGFCSHNNL